MQVKKWLAGVVASALILLAGIMGWAWYAFPQEDPAKVISTQFLALQAGDVDRAYGYTSADFQKTTSLRDFERFVERYTVFTKKASIQIKNQWIDRQQIVVKVALNASDSDEQPLLVEYTLLKENDAWKILRIQMVPKAKLPFSPLPIQLSNLFDNHLSRYRINYPSTWMSEKLSEAIFVMSGRVGTQSYYSSVNIQTVLTKKNGGKFSTVKQFIGDIKQQLHHGVSDVNIIESGPVALPSSTGELISGEYLVFTYTLQGRTYKQWQIVVMRHDHQVFYAWAFTAPVRQYNFDFPVAKAILDSWVVY